MNKAILFFFSAGIFPLLAAQDKSHLNHLFEKEKVQNEQKFETFTQKNNIQSQTQKNYLKSILAGFAGNHPLYWDSDDIRANRSANIVALQNGSLTGLSSQPVTGSGQNIIVMDGGRVFDKHVDFGASSTGVVTTPRVFDKENGNASYNFHATNCAGVIGSEGISNSNTLGVIKQVQIDSYAFATTPLGTNYQKLNNAANANISNHSYGINLGWSYRDSPTAGWYWISDYDFSTSDTWSGSYGTQDANFDQIVYSNPNQVVIKSAGNYYGDGPNGSFSNAFKQNSSGSYVPFTSTDVIPPNNCSNGYNCIGWGSLAKNVIIVGATNQLLTLGNVYSSSSDVVKASFSSAGPRKDGAIKPDISAVGVDLRMPTYSSSTNYTAFSTSSGTSYSGPVITGIAGALTEIKRKLSGNTTFTYKADEMKAILLHTTQEAGPNPGPDVHFGWGFADATAGAQLLIDNQNNQNTISRKLLVSGTTHERALKAVTGKPLKVTVSWIDPAAQPFVTSNDLQNNLSSKLVNDIDVRIVDTVDNTIYYPWKLNAMSPMSAATKGDNVVDNVEQVIIDNPVAGRIYMVQVTNKGTLVNDFGTPTPQNYAVVMTGYDPAFSLATDETELKDLISVYPTLVEDFVTVLIPSKAENIKIFDMSGKIVYEAEAEKHQVIDFRSLSNGVYNIAIETSEGIITKRIIKK